MRVKKLVFFQLGFTMVEILIVVAIISLLAIFLLATLNYKTQMQKARDAKRKNDLRVIKNKLEDYYNDNESYPEPPGCTEASCCLKISCDHTFLSPYLANFPCDPSQKEYVYCAQSEKSSWYKIYTKIEYLKDLTLEASECKNGCLAAGGCYNYGVSSPNVSLATTGCGGITPTTAPIPTPDESKIYTACQGGICNVIEDPVHRCPPLGGDFSECFQSDLTCGHCKQPGCLPDPQCRE